MYGSISHDAVCSIERERQEWRSSVWDGVSTTRVRNVDRQRVLSVCPISSGVCQVPPSYLPACAAETSSDRQISPHSELNAGSTQLERKSWIQATSTRL